MIATLSTIGDEFEQDSAIGIATALARDYGAIPEVTAVALGGSRAAAVADAISDLDLYVYYADEISLAARGAIATARGSGVELDNRAFEPGDAWVEAASGVAVDVTFRHTAWIEGTLDWTLNRHGASVGYSTAIWANVLASHILFDRDGWFAALRARSDVAYPESLRRAIIAKNHPLLRDGLFSFVHQLESAVARGDGVSVNHRVAALLASYFDILFALNRVPHPGEKRLGALATARCDTLPEGMAKDIAALLAAAASPGSDVIEAANRLMDALDRVLREDRLIVP
jgi:hypothetical protein